MKSIKDIYKIGRGPSSSHTMGPEKACRMLKEAYPTADRYTAVLYGSLALTGVGHGTDRVIRETLSPLRGEVVFDGKTGGLPHPHTMDISLSRGGDTPCRHRVLRIGGGDLLFEGEPMEILPEVYAEKSFAEITGVCEARNMRIWQYVLQKEGEECFTYLSTVWNVMKDAVNRGLSTGGVLPGGLNTQRRAKIIYQKKHIDESPQTKENRLVCAYAFAVGEDMRHPIGVGKG
ncbi:MAG: serine dehydratase, partial [Clostridia bacterium]|nr:serine dehydratase [Clostridia bacterium]